VFVAAPLTAFAGGEPERPASEGSRAIDCPASAAGVTERLAKIANGEGVRFLILGEIHGTKEIPALVADAACAISRTRPVVVALEIHTRAQADIDAYLASDGGEAARNLLLDGPAWAIRTADGRSSQAMLDLIETLRVLRQEGAPIDRRPPRLCTGRAPASLFRNHDGRRLDGGGRHAT